MSPIDWHDQLASLRTSLPEGEDLVASTQDSSAPTIPGQNLHIRLERKGRGGKSATIISGFTLTPEEMASLATEIKKSLGIGGSWRDDEILLQGDCREKATHWLRSHSHKVK